jgi:hypothetical protein
MIIKHPKNGSTPDFDWRYLDTSNELVCPWYTMDTLLWLDFIHLSDKSVFEYGCGLSSYWWQKKTKKWSGVDNSATWGEPCGCKIETDLTNYVESCTDTYDIVVVDGIWRNECIKHALTKINKNGYLIVDNWDQASVDMPESFWKPSIDLLSNYKRWIYKEAEHVDWKTAVFQIK